ncbi:hypothetical protein L593_06265 [Salinarchaeum sp. Harcht-Bsk1]|nr:hypothetical protein L593_06265 [Salinarchaeum sp. Harcht-Bsk1]
MLLYLLLLLNSDSVDQSSEIFARTFYTFMMAFFPTNEVALILDVIMGTLGASVAASELRAKTVGILIAFGFCWSATNILINWFTAPI